MGDFDISGSGGAGLDAFAARLQRLASPEGQQAMNKAAGEVVKDLVLNGFRTGTDPYGNAWRATVAGNQPLIGPSRELSTSVGMVVTSEGFIIVVSDWKAVFHQGGTKRGIPARPMLPTRTTMPPKWRVGMTVSIKLYLETALRG